MGCSQIRDQIYVSCMGRRLLYHWAAREAHEFYYLVSNKKNANKNNKCNFKLLYWQYLTRMQEKRNSYIILLGLTICRKLCWAHAITDTNLNMDKEIITLLTKVFIVKAMVFLVVIYGCDSWTMKKVEHQRIDAFKLWCWIRLLRVPWTARRSNSQS